MTGIGLVDEPSYHAPVEVRARVTRKAAPTRMAMISAVEELRSVLGAPENLQARIDSIYAAANARIKTLRHQRAGRGPKRGRRAPFRLALSG